MFYKPGEYEIRDGEFYSVQTGKPLNSGDLAGLIAYCEPNDISPIETYGKTIVSQHREVVPVGGKTMLYKGAVIKI